MPQTSTKYLYPIGASMYPVAKKDVGLQDEDDIE